MTMLLDNSDVIGGHESENSMVLVYGGIEVWLGLSFFVFFCSLSLYVPFMLMIVVV